MQLYTTEFIRRLAKKLWYSHCQVSFEPTRREELNRVTTLARAGADDVALVAQAFAGVHQVGSQVTQISAADVAPHISQRVVMRFCHFC